MKTTINKLFFHTLFHSQNISEDLIKKFIIILENNENSL